MQVWRTTRAMSSNISLLRLLPKGDSTAFMNFLYPLRARAAVFLSSIFILFYIMEIIARTIVRKDEIDTFYLVRRCLIFVVTSGLFVSALIGSATVVSLTAHGWYIISALSRVILFASFVGISTRPDVITFVSSVMTSVLTTTSVGVTMHIDFVMILVLSAVELGLTITAITRGFDDFDLKYPETLISVTALLYLLSLWAVHTAQYNTVMMFIYDKQYRIEKIEKYAQQKMEELHRLHLANTLHDIGSPLQAFVNGLDDIRENCSNVPVTEDFNIHETLSSMESSITLISLARRRAIAYAKSFSEPDQNLEPNFSEVEIRQLLAECWKVIQALNRNRHVQVPIESMVDDDVPQLIYADADWLLEAMTNYLSNAMRSTQRGYIRARIYLVSAAEATAGSTLATLSRASDSQREHLKTKLRFEVADTGTNLPVTGTDNMFRPLGIGQHQMDASGLINLGLVGVKAKVEHLGGSVGVEPNIPNGAIFWFDIPLTMVPSTPSHHMLDLSIPVTPSAQAHAQAHPPSLELQQLAVVSETPSLPPLEPSQPSPTAAPSPPCLSPRLIMTENQIDPSKLHMLIVEDEKVLMKFVKKMFMRFGFTVEEAYDGQHALECMQTNPYDVVLMDQNMPQLGGLEAVRLFREWQQKYSTDKVSTQRCAKILSPSAFNSKVFDPVIFMMSASILEADRIEARDLHIAYYFDKPLQIKVVAAKVLSHLVSQTHRLQRIQITQEQSPVER